MPGKKFKLSLRLAALASLFLLQNAFAQSKIYWTETGANAKIRVANLLDPSTPATIYTTADGLSDPGPIVVNSTTSDLFWVDKGDDIIKFVTGKTDGSAAPQVLITADSGSSLINFATIEYLAIDTTNGKLYWSDFGRNRVQRADLDGTNVENVLDGVSGPVGLSIDVTNQFLYRADSVLQQLSRLDLSSGSQSEEIILSNSNFSGLTPKALIFDSGSLYWQNNQSTDYGIYTTTVGGSSATQLKSISISHVIKALGISAKHQKLYFINSSINEITALDLSDNSTSSFLTNTEHGVTQPVGLTMDVVCPQDQTKDAPGICGCGVADDDADSDGVIDCIESPELTPGFEIEDPPTVTVEGRRVTITMQEFSGVTLGALAQPSTMAKTKARRGQLIIKYQVTVRPTGSGTVRSDIRRRLTKRNEITFRNLSPGNYTTRYRAVIVRNQRTVGRSTYSPAQTFSVE